jgi:secondary thiamine-phosphate synthase enzyme
MSNEVFPVTWVQRELQLPPMRKGCHPITERIIEAMPELQYVRVGLLHLFIQHTSASLTINENADPAVLKDLDDVLDSLVP